MNLTCRCTNMVITFLLVQMGILHQERVTHGQAHIHTQHHCCLETKSQRVRETILMVIKKVVKKAMSFAYFSQIISGMHDKGRGVVQHREWM